MHVNDLLKTAVEQGASDLHIKVGRGHRGPVTEAIQQKFFQIVKGETPDTHGWLQPVYKRETATSRA